MVKKTKAILLIEDEPLIREIYVTMLRAENIKIFEAIGGEDADEILKKEKIDLILLDILLPKEDGLSYLEKAKTQYSNLPPVIVLSNFEGKEYRERAQALDAKDYFLKTDYEPSKLLELIKKYL